MKRNNQTLYQDHAQTWWDNPQRFQRLLANQEPPRLAYFDRIALHWQGLAVLDLGCGGGFTAEALARRGAKVIGVDPSTASLEAGHHHAHAAGLEIKYHAGIGEAIPLATHSIDRVVCVEVLEHVEDLPQVLREVHRVLRPQGLFFFSTVNRNWLSALLAITIAEKILHLIPRGTHEASRFIRPGEMTHHLEQVGFTVKPEQFIGMGPVGINRRLDFVFGLLPVTWIMYLGYAIANKR